MGSIRHCLAGLQVCFWVEGSRIAPFHFVAQQVMDRTRTLGDVLWIEVIFVGKTAGEQASNRQKFTSCFYKLHNYILCPDDPSNIHTGIANIPHVP